MTWVGSHRAVTDSEDVAVRRAWLGGFCWGMAAVLLALGAAHLWLWTF